MDAMVLRAAMCGRTVPERTVKSCGPDAPVLASSFAGAKASRDDGGKKAGHRGELV
jgi:hypothetical protein